jgi:glycosyltransferase involved in cell wall biosynthesis
MRVLIVHNSYQFAGGEEGAVAGDQALLAARGHETRLFTKAFEDLQTPRRSRTRLAIDAIWSRTTYAELRELLRSWRPDVAHFHNIFPLVSPSAYAACRAERVPVVQTLHNYRLVCPAGTLLRNGQPCELCVGTVPWRAVQFSCYRGSRLQSLGLASVLTVHRGAGTWTHQVDAYIALTEFARRIFLRGGLPADRIFLRPNSVAAQEPLSYAGPRDALYIGRLSPEKGVDVLVDAWSDVPDVPLTIIGDGPLLDGLRAAVTTRGLAQVTVRGRVSHDEVLACLRRAGMLVFPSIWYEGLPLTLLEALSAGVPVIASALGAQAEVVHDGVSGLLVPPGDPRAFAAAVRRLVREPGLAQALARGAREEFQKRYSPDASFEALMRVYAEAAARAQSRRSPRI